MRLLAAVTLMAALSGCGDRRNFDQRYEDTSEKLEEKARQLDQNIAAEAGNEALANEAVSR